MLCNGLAAAERSGNSRNASLCYREKTVHNSLTRYKRHIRRELLAVRSALSYCPFLEHFDFFFFLACINHADNFVKGKFSLFDTLDSTAYAVGNHYLMENYIRFGDCAYDIAARYGIALFDSGSEFPFPVSFK